jgi:hypothetical protein
MHNCDFFLLIRVSNIKIIKRLLYHKIKTSNWTTRHLYLNLFTCVVWVINAYKNGGINADYMAGPNGKFTIEQ